MADTTNVNEFTIFHEKLDQIKTDISELKEDFKTHKQNIDNRLIALETRVNKVEQDYQIEKLKLANIETLHKADMERMNKKWDLPNKIAFSIFGVISGGLLTALLNLILK